MFDLMLSPETALARRRVNVAAELLLDAVQENDALSNHRVPNLTAFYWSEFGPLEISLYEAELKRDQTAMRIRLIRQYLNRGEPIDLPVIEVKITASFADRVRYLAFMRSQLNEATSYLALPVLSDSESEELNTLYKQLIKALHPDLHPHQSAADAWLFLKVLDAYANGLLEVLEAIAAMLANREDETLSPQELNRQLADLLTDLAQERARKFALYQAWPLTIEAQLKSETWRDHHRAALQLALNRLKQQVAANIVLYGQLVGDLGGDRHG
ncbi:J domain-containing protein [Lacticaseibacillus hegangensis]|uniref:J domain-containing protein n=1 Tax=Lacticaseibacillus hegangensis TaxID=2486010 RepID=A0ABW4CVN1_9LACO|nr:J domain-containing protein [Lacticaseibacillus hegangensis]